MKVLTVRKFHLVSEDSRISKPHSLPGVTIKNFFLTISIHFRADR